MSEKPDFQDWEKGTAAVVLKYERCIAALTRDRDEAQAKLWIELVAAANARLEIPKAEARGYERGVKEAAAEKVAADGVRLQNAPPTGVKYANPLELAYADRAGFERGVREAAKVAEVTADKFSSERTIRTILALLEPAVQEQSK